MARHGSNFLSVGKSNLAGKPATRMPDASPEWYHNLKREVIAPVAVENTPTTSRRNRSLEYRVRYLWRRET